MSALRPTILRRALAGLLLATGALVATAAPASAAIVSTDRPLMSGPQRDFGNNQFLGTPLNGGIVNWDVTNGIVTPWISGQLYVNNLSGVCTKVQVEYHDSAHHLLAIRESPLFCEPDNRSNQHTISIPLFGSAAVDHVIIKINGQNTNGTFTTVNSVVESR